jgi:hypothetical protein
MIPQEIMNKYSQEQNSIIEGAYLAGFEPSVDGLTGYALFSEAVEFLRFEATLFM